MSWLDFIRNLSISPRFAWDKRQRDDKSTASKVKQRNKGNHNYAAGRDMNIYRTEKKGKEADKPPFAFFETAISSNGVIMSFVAGKAHNLSDRHVFLESIEINGIAHSMRDRLIRAGEEVGVHSIASMPMLDTDAPVYFDMIYRDIDGNRYKARHTSELQHMAIDKYKIIQIFRPKTIEPLGKSVH